MAETVFSNLRARGTLAVVGIATLALATISNTLTLQKTVNFTPDGTSTGAVIQVSGLTRIQTLNADCTATGGLTKYSTCVLNSPLSTTGSLMEVSLECGNVSKQLTGDVGFKLTKFSDTGAALTSLADVALGTGTLQRSAFATEVAWNPAERLTFSTLVTPSGTVDCEMWATIADKYGD